MNTKQTRDQIVEAADDLFYQKGFERTSFTDIADAVDISRGNFYYHFKTKDEILKAVINLRMAKTQKMLTDWEAQSETPKERIKCFIHILVANWAKINLYGCPVGVLCTELSKLNHASHDQANEIFTMFRIWLCDQFKLAGCGSDSDDLAMHILARSQGVAVLANAFRDKKFVELEVKLMCEWVDSCLRRRKQPSRPGARSSQRLETAAIN